MQQTLTYQNTLVALLAHFDIVYPYFSAWPVYANFTDSALQLPTPPLSQLVAELCIVFALNNMACFPSALPWKRNMVKAPDEASTALNSKLLA